jgi:hypothetical protein
LLLDGVILVHIAVTILRRVRTKCNLLSFFEIITQTYVIMEMKTNLSLQTVLKHANYTLYVILMTVIKT